MAGGKGIKRDHYRKGDRVVWSHRIARNWELREWAEVERGGQGSVLIRLNHSILVGPKRIAGDLLEVSCEELETR